MITTFCKTKYHRLNPLSSATINKQLTNAKMFPPKAYLCINALLDIMAGPLTLCVNKYRTNCITHATL